MKSFLNLLQLGNKRNTSEDEWNNNILKGIKLLELGKKE